MTPAPVHLAQLADSLSLEPGSVVAFVGGGGKTTLLHGLAKQLATAPFDGSVIATTTTKMSTSQHGDMPLLLDPTNDDVRDQLLDGSPLMIWRRTEACKAIGFDRQRCDDWASLADFVLIEADGSRRRPFKAPGPLEPEVPATTTDLVSVIGVDALDRVILDQCHRPLRVAGLAGCQPGERLTPARAATVLLHPRGMRRALPPGGRLHIGITKVAPATRPTAELLAKAIAAAEPDVNVVLVREVATPTG